LQWHAKPASSLGTIAAIRGVRVKGLGASPTRGDTLANKDERIGVSSKGTSTREGALAPAMHFPLHTQTRNWSSSGRP